MPLNKEELEAMNLVVDLMETSTKWTQNLTNSLMDQYREEGIRARCELKAVRIQMSRLFSSGYMPTESAIFDALVPDETLVNSLMKEKSLGY